MFSYKKVLFSAIYSAASVHKKYFKKIKNIKTKSHSFDYLTASDIEAEAIAVKIIKKNFPEHNIFAEENTYPKTSSPFTWIIDPLDGTNNFAHNLPIFSISLALAKKDKLLLGAVYNPVQEELFFAVSGKGAYLNKKRIKVNDISSLDKALLITGFYYDRGKKMRENLKIIERFFNKNIVGIRRFGSAALDLCYLASGRVSGFWEFELSPWDFAAGKLILEEAGGKLTDEKGRNVSLFKSSYIVASNKKIHKDMLKVINGNE